MLRKKNHLKSKRSLNGQDVYESACKYDVGWSKSKKRKNENISHEARGEGKHKIHDSSKNNNNGKQQKSIEYKTEEGFYNCESSNNAVLKISKTSDGGKITKNKISEDMNIANDLNPLHAKWKFTTKELADLKDKGVKVKLGGWSKKEIKTLETNMNNYLKANDITDPMPLILAEGGRREKGIKMQSKSTNFYRCLGEGIDRPLFHVYRRVLRVYNSENHLGRWSESDTQSLLRFHEMYGDKWTKIGSFLGRSGMSVHHRYLELQAEHVGHWSEDEVERLDASVRASTGTEFGSQIYGEINWTEVAIFVMTRTAEQCRSKWIKDVCWRTANGDKSIKWNSQDDVKLIERLYESNETDENDINWVQLTKDLANSPSVTWLRTKWSTLKKAVPNYTECDFEELLDYLYNTHRTFLEKKPIHGTKRT